MKEKASNLKQDDVDEREELDLMVKNFQNDHIFKNIDFLAAKVLAMSIDPTIPNEIQKNDSLRYRFYLDHYWDNIDVTDNRIVHTPVYHKKLDFFFLWVSKANVKVKSVPPRGMPSAYYRI